MNVKIEESWRQHIGEEFDKPYFAGLTEFVRSEYTSTTCYPPGSLIFNAFNLCPFDKVKVVIIGQDPYHEPGQAHGLSFSVNDGVPSRHLLSIFSRRYSSTSAHRCRRAAILHGGRSRVCFCSMPRSRCVPVRRRAISGEGGSSSPMPPYGRSMLAVSTSCSSYGVAMHAARHRSSIRHGILYCSRFIRRRCLPTVADGSETITFPGRTII